MGKRNTESEERHGKGAKHNTKLKEERGTEKNTILNNREKNG